MYIYTLNIDRYNIYIPTHTHTCVYIYIYSTCPELEPCGSLAFSLKSERLLVHTCLKPICFLSQVNILTQLEGPEW